MEALLSDEAIADEAKKFDSSVKMLTLREYDYLDFRLIYNYILSHLCQKWCVNII